MLMGNFSFGPTGPYPLGAADVRTLLGLAPTDIPVFGGIKVGANQVLAAQQPSIANAGASVSSGLNTVDYGSLVGFAASTNGKINAILLALRAHGLIGP
jgi:hypothetical protein